MKKYYWDMESERVISIDELDKIRSEFYPDDSMEKFMCDCSYMNNGAIEPLSMEIQRLEKTLQSMLDDVTHMQTYIAYLKKIEKE